MKSTHLKIFLFIITSSMLTAAQAAKTHSHSLLDGIWSSKCAPNNSGGFIVETFNFSGNSAKYITKTYKDSDCKHLISVLSTYQIYHLGNLIAHSNHIRKLNYVFKSVTMTYTTPSDVADANKAPGYYGFTNWKINQPKVVSGLKRTQDSDPERKKGEKFYTIVKKHNNALYMGDYASGEGTSDKTRLSKIYDVPFYKSKQ